MAHENDPSNPVAQQAAGWWIVFHEEQAAPADHREFANWVSRSPERVAAYLKTALVEQALKSPAVQWTSTTREELIRESRAFSANVVSISEATASLPAENSHSRKHRGWQLGLALAASLFMAIGAAWFFTNRPAQYSTRLGEQRSLMLRDGSRVTLNTSSRVEVDFRRERRIVRLVEGEALFDVAHDASRPFDVQTSHAVLRAVGTQFDVDVRPGGTTVTIVEGRVAVVANSVGDTAGRVPLLEVADRLVIGTAGTGTTEHGVNIDAATSWTKHQLVFWHRPLGEVAEEFNRYNSVRLRIENGELRKQLISGTFQSNDVASFISFLSGAPDVVISKDGPDGYVVRLRDERPAGSSTGK
ncbi:MAG: FecR domain-containing protein [Gammaproteobacteria bacterium]